MAHKNTKKTIYGIPNGIFYIILTAILLAAIMFLKNIANKHDKTGVAALIKEVTIYPLGVIGISYVFLTMKMLKIKMKIGVHVCIVALLYIAVLLTLYKGSITDLIEGGITERMSLNYAEYKKASYSRGMSDYYFILSFANRNNTEQNNINMKIGRSKHDKSILSDALSEKIIIGNTLYQKEEYIKNYKKYINIKTYPLYQEGENKYIFVTYYPRSKLLIDVKKIMD